MQRSIAYVRYAVTAIGLTGGYPGILIRIRIRRHPAYGKVHGGLAPAHCTSDTGHAMSRDRKRGCAGKNGRILLDMCVE